MKVYRSRQKILHWTCCAEWDFGYWFCNGLYHMEQCEALSGLAQSYSVDKAARWRGKVGLAQSYTVDKAARWKGIVLKWMCPASVQHLHNLALNINQASISSIIRMGTLVSWREQRILTRKLTEGKTVDFVCQQVCLEVYLDKLKSLSLFEQDSSSALLELSGIQPLK